MTLHHLPGCIYISKKRKRETVVNDKSNHSQPTILYPQITSVLEVLILGFFGLITSCCTTMPNSFVLQPKQYKVTFLLRLVSYFYLLFINLTVCFIIELEQSQPNYYTNGKHGDGNRNNGRDREG